MGSCRRQLVAVFHAAHYVAVLFLSAFQRERFCHMASIFMYPTLTLMLGTLTFHPIAYSAGYLLAAHPSPGGVVVGVAALLGLLIALSMLAGLLLWGRGKGVDADGGGGLPSSAAVPYCSTDATRLVVEMPTFLRLVRMREDSSSRRRLQSSRILRALDLCQGWLLPWVFWRDATSKATRFAFTKRFAFLWSSWRPRYNTS